MILALPNKDQRRDKNQKTSTFSDTQQVSTTRCTLSFFWGQSKFKVYIVRLNRGSCQFAYRIFEFWDSRFTQGWQINCFVLKKNSCNKDDIEGAFGYLVTFYEVSGRKMWVSFLKASIMI